MYIYIFIHIYLWLFFNIYLCMFAKIKTQSNGCTFLVICVIRNLVENNQHLLSNVVLIVTTFLNICDIDNTILYDLDALLFQTHLMLCTYNITLIKLL